MTAVRNTIFYSKQGEMIDLMDLVYKGKIKQTDVVIKEYRSGDAFHVIDELVPNTDESVLLFEGMIIERIRHDRDLIILEFDFDKWRQRKNSKLFIENVQWRKKTLQKKQKPSI